MGWRVDKRGRSLSSVEKGLVSMYHLVKMSGPIEASRGESEGEAMIDLGVYIVDCGWKMGVLWLI